MSEVSKYMENLIFNLWYLLSSIVMEELEIQLIIESFAIDNFQYLITYSTKDEGNIYWKLLFPLIILFNNLNPYYLL